jgi:hypothetical protein
MDLLTYTLKATKIYLSGNGYGLEEAKASIEVVQQIRNAVRVLAKSGKLSSIRIELAVSLFTHFSRTKSNLLNSNHFAKVENQP